MHHPTATPRASIYYKYQVHSAWVPNASDQSRNDAQRNDRVVIVGAGPSGLCTALLLAQYGVPCVILESELQVSEGSRAIVFTRRSMEILQCAGVAHKVSEQGLPWRFGNSFFRGQQVFRMEAPYSEDDRFYPMINLQQQYLEQYLLDAVKANPLIEMRWGNCLTAVRQNEQEVQLEVDTPEGSYTLTSPWLVAADGPRSFVRNALNLKLEGASYEGRFVIADIRVDLPLPTERLAYFDPPWNPNNTVLMHREPHGIWRVDYQLPQGETPEQALQMDSMRSRIDAQLALIGHAGAPWELDWCSVYSARTLTLPDYVHGRVLFTGDAAHLLPIFGVRGANTAFQDAQSLAWHLAAVMLGWAPTQHIHNYSAERVLAAKEIIQEAGKSTRFMTPPSAGFRVLRDAVLSLSLKHGFVRPLYHWRTSRPHEYTHSALNSLDDDTNLFEHGPAHGSAAVNVKLADNYYLLDVLGGAFDLLYIAPKVETPTQLIPKDVCEHIAHWRAQGVKIKLIVVSQHTQIDGADAALFDPNRRIAQVYGVHDGGGAYLFRPDQHVCARWLQLDGARFSAAMQQALSGGM